MAPFYSRAHTSSSLAGGTELNTAAEAQQPAESTRKYSLLSSQSGHRARAWLQGSGKLPLLLFHANTLPIQSSHSKPVNFSVLPQLTSESRIAKNINYHRC